MTSIEECSVALSFTESTRSDTDLTALVETYASLLFRVAHSILRSQSEAEDVVQDVFVRTLQHRNSLPAVREMRVWLVRIAWNLALDRKRRIRPEQFDSHFAESLVACSVPADQAIDEAQRLKSVLDELERLPKGERHVILLSAVEELGTTEIGAVLGRSESAVRALLFRARTRLRKRLEQGGKR
jgi:RNA polymerase sigma-70 factor (ECF subfamily)